MLGDFPRLAELYDSEEKRALAYHAALVEAAGYCRWTRLREIAELAERLGYTRVGVAHCPDMAREAVLTAVYLRDQQIDVRLPPDKPGCDPLGQAQLFASQDTHLNVVAGMCVGHEAMFIRASRAPVTVLVARDERFRHNPVAALYTAGSYSHNELYGRRREPRPFRGWDDETLAAASDELLPDKHDRWSRVRETIEYAHRLGVGHIGVSFCVGFREEARLLTRVLEANGFRVTSICCKSGAVPKEEIGITESQKVRPGQTEMICNPLAQAEVLNRADVQLALILGQCVGHDSATLAQLAVPAVCIVAKDRVLAHNTVAALYQLEG
jgi:uncharacterized metal-binding protein